MKIEILSIALQELNDAYLYYEEQQHGLGDRFIECFEESSKNASGYPYRWKKISMSTHRIIVKTFPYLILYVPEENRITITCIAHSRRNPKYYLSRGI